MNNTNRICIPFNVFMKLGDLDYYDELEDYLSDDVLNKVKNYICDEDENIKSEYKTIVDQVIEDFNNKYLKELDSNVSDKLGVSVTRIYDGDMDRNLEVRNTEYAVSDLPFTIKIGQPGYILLFFSEDGCSGEDFYDEDLIDITNINISSLSNKIMSNMHNSHGSALDTFIDYVGLDPGFIIIDLKQQSTSYNANKLYIVVSSLLELINENSSGDLCIKYPNGDMDDSIKNCVNFIINNYECSDPDNIEILKTI